MEAEFKREWMETYLQLPCNQEEAAEYQEKMIFYNPGGGILPCTKKVTEEGTLIYQYPVTGKKTLHSIYATIPMREEQIRSILQQVIEVLAYGRDLLLSEDGFVLDPHYIFTLLPDLRLDFCYLPGHHGELKKQLEALLEYLLNRVDYQDKGAVELLYDCYLFCIRDGKGLREIRERLLQRETAETVPLPCPEREKSREAETTREEPSYTSWLTGLFRRGRRAEPITEEQTKRQKEREKEKEAELPLPPVTDGGATVHLSSGPGKSSRQEPRLLNEKTGEVILISDTPFYLGGMEGYVNYVMREEGVSRLHACIGKKEEGYVLSDLNSTNGTFLNRKEVLPGQEVRLVPNDVIRIAKEEFVFQL